jgi:4-amino-4-deoxy-L-arabinose transferase-like glycosyltransferase
MSVSAARQQPAPQPLAPALAYRFPPLAFALLASLLAWTVLFASVPFARQDFPLNDDWAFAHGAFLFAKGEGIHYGGWASMPQLGQWLWACPFVWLLGESHAALRLATVVLSWLGLWAFFDLLRQRGVSASRAALATGVLAFNPLLFLLQGTFMTDVPALSLALAALALYGRALERADAGRLPAACLVAVLAALTRQNTVAVALVAAVLLWRRPELRRLPGWWAGVLLPAAVGVVVHLWFGQRTDVRPMKPTVVAPATLLSLPYIAVHFLALSALPLLLLWPRPTSWKGSAGVLAVLLACAGYWLLYGTYLPYGGLFPYAENMLTPWGAFAGSRFTGPFVVGSRPVLLVTAVRVALTLLGCLAGAVLVDRLLSRRGGDWDSPLVLFTLLQVPFLLVAVDFYDRYLLFLLPGVLALAAEAAEAAPRSRVWGLAGLAAAVLVGVLSVGMMHDWLAWNGARWALGRRAMPSVEALDIEGGVEWDGWFTLPLKAPPAAGPLRWPVLRFTREWFPAVRGRLALSFSHVRGTRVVDTEPYDLWLDPGEHRFFLLAVPPLPPPPPGRARGE